MPPQSMYERVGQPADLYQRVLYLLNGGATRRFHTITTIKDVTVAAHQYTVAWLCYVLTKEPALNLIMAALVHDTAEQVVGDVPSPTKKMLGSDVMFLRTEVKLLQDNCAEFLLTREEEHVLSIADKLAGMLECVQERALGNRNVELSFGRWAAYINNMTLTVNELAVYAVVQRLWKEATN